jgi:acylphosphatase
MKQVHLLISGFVQGVGYREFVRSNAKKLGLTGWVRNLSDQRVELVAYGVENDLKELIELCEKGPFLAEVTSVAVEWQTPEEKFDSFEKKPTI